MNGFLEVEGVQLFVYKLSMREAFVNLKITCG